MVKRVEMAERSGFRFDAQMGEPDGSTQNTALGSAARFLRTEAGGGFALLVGAFVALVWVNLIDADSYNAL